MRVLHRDTTCLFAAALSAAMTGCATPGESVITSRPVTPVIARKSAEVGRVEAGGISDPRVRAIPREVPNPLVPPIEPIHFEENVSAVEAVPGPVYSPVEAVRFALENNPGLQAVRHQRGFARGGVVIARTYPYNPISQLQFFGVTGDGVTNRLSQAHKVTMDVEVFGQRFRRREAAQAVVSRTEWEIATQEIAIAISATRAFNTVVYRQRKLEVLEDTVRFNTDVVDQVKKLVDLGRLRPADLVVARTELDAARAQLGQGRTAIAFARADLRRQFGTFDDTFVVRGELDLPIPTMEYDVHAKAALEQRPDLQSRRFAVDEAQARLRLQAADRFGNPNIGPAFDYNETRNAFIGMQIGGPIPVFNRRTGEIIQAQALFARAVAEVHQFEVQSGQDVQAALARMTEARKWVESYSAEVLPSLRKAVQDMNKLFEQNEPGVDVLRVIGVQRNYLRAFDAYLDALLELSQSRADLAAAVGDPALALGLYPSKEKPAPGRDPLPAPKPAPAPAKDQP